MARVSVVIPTAGRSSLGAAVQSALDQVGVEVEVLVVHNGANRLMVDVPGASVLSSPPDLGANGARQLGIERAKHDLVALLDDDDTWDEDKLKTQVDFALEHLADLSADWVAGCGLRIESDGVVDGPAPLDAAPFPIVPDQYLFERLTMSDRRHQLQTSTLLFPRSLGARVPFRAEIPMHQDWTWLLEVQRTTAAVFGACPDVLVTYVKSSPGSITTSSRSAESTAWAREWLSHDARIRGDFLLTVPFNMASREGFRAQTRILIAALISARPGRFSFARALMVLPRTMLLRLAALKARRARSGQAESARPVVDPREGG